MAMTLRGKLTARGVLLACLSVAILTSALASAPAAHAATDPLVTSLRQRAVLVEPGTAANARALRAEALKLARSGYPTKIAVLASASPPRPIAYARSVRRALGSRWAVVIVWPDGRGDQSTFAFDSPAPQASMNRVEREVIAEARRTKGPGIFTRVARETARRIAWYSLPQERPRSGRLLQLDADAALERLVKLPAGVRFPAATVPGYQFAIVDRGRTTRIGDPGERMQGPVAGDHLGAGSGNQLMLRWANGNSLFFGKLIAWSGSAERVLWRENNADLEEGLPPDLFAGGSTSLTFVDPDGDGVQDLEVAAFILRCRGCEPEGSRVATYRYDPARDRYLFVSLREA